jgi:hypothetical protein
MDALLELPFQFIRPPVMRLKLPQIPSVGPMTVFALMFFSYFLVISGIIYDVIVEPPSMGTTRDEVTGAIKPVAFLKYRVNGQFIIEGLSAGLFFAMGAIGIIILDKSNAKGMSENARYLLIVVGALLVGLAYVVSIVFLRMKIPGYGF